MLWVMSRQGRFITVKHAKIVCWLVSKVQCKSRKVFSQGTHFVVLLEYLSGD